MYTDPEWITTKKFLWVHTHYQQRGGEDLSFEVETKLLREKGCEVFLFEHNNDHLSQYNQFHAGLLTIWNQKIYQEFSHYIKQVKPDVIHVNNTFPLISPAIYYAAKKERIPVIKTLRNYRLMCLNGIFSRDGHVCEDCLGHFPINGIVHKCYRESYPASAAVAAMLSTHRVLGTWREKIDYYIALTEFAKRKFIEGGLPPEKILVKPNFVHPDPGQGQGLGEYALFIGRLSPEKGIQTLLQAWRMLGDKIPLYIVGDGPLREMVSTAEREIPGIQWLGYKNSTEVFELLGEASCVIFPAESYEGFPRVIAESFAKGTPVIASNLGGAAEIVTHGQTGYLFHPGEANDLVAQVKLLFSNPQERMHLRRNARLEFEQKYTGEINFSMLMDIYRKAIQISGYGV